MAIFINWLKLKIKIPSPYPKCYANQKEEGKERHLGFIEAEVNNISHKCIYEVIKSQVNVGVLTTIYILRV